MQYWWEENECFVPFQNLITLLLVSVNFFTSVSDGSLTSETVRKTASLYDTPYK